jgi:hypothetical protein
MSPARARPDPTIATVGEAFQYAQGLQSTTFHTYFSNALAQVFANRLRPHFPGILPDQHGAGVESRTRSARGFKKLDVNYSTPQTGLGLGVSIKTINSRDPGTRRYTKNYSRNDNELRAEAMDYHMRQPYAVLAAVLFLPWDACEDAGSGRGEESGVSSFGAAVRYFRVRAPRPDPDDPPDLFEAMWVALYDGATNCVFYSVSRPGPPKNRAPRDDEVEDLAQVVDSIRATYDARNNPPFKWAEE